MEELNESEVMWPDDDCRTNVVVKRSPDWSWSSFPAAPKDIANMSSEEKKGWLPPHVEEACRQWGMEGRAAMSVCSGQGWMLKGRDLCDFRDYALCLTGFLEG